MDPESRWLTALLVIIIILVLPPPITRLYHHTYAQSTPTPNPTHTGVQLPPDDEIQGQFGIISVTTEKSCASISPDLRCNDACSSGSPADCQGFATDMQLFIAQNETFTYNFLALVPRDLVGTPGTSGQVCLTRVTEPPSSGGGVGTTTTSNVGTASSTQTGGDEDPSGTCLVSRQLSMAITMSPITSGYQLIYRSDLVLPFAITSHHTNTYQRQSPGTEGSFTGDCQGFAKFFPNGGIPSENAFFYNNVRIDNMAMTAQSNQNQSARQDVQKQWGDYDLQSDGACKSDGWDYDNHQDDVLVCTSGHWEPVADPASSDPAITRNFGLRAFFDAPIVSSSYPEGDSSRGNYANSKNLCCGTIGVEAQDEEYCSERGVNCELSIPMVGIYMDPSRYNVYPKPYPGSQGNLYWTGVEFGGYQHEDSCTEFDEGNQNCGNGPRDDEAVTADASICSSVYQNGCHVCDGVSLADLSGISTSPACSGDGVTTFDNNQLDFNLRSKITASRPTRRFFSPMSEGQDDDNMQQGPDDNNNDDANAGYICESGSKSRRSYCSDACIKKFMQNLMTVSSGSPTELGHGTDPYTSPAGRMFAGTAPVFQPIYKCFDDGGDYDDIDNTGINQTCWDQCALTPETCNPYEECVDPERWPNLDDCDEDNDRKTVVIGPERVMETYPVLIGVSELFSYNPNFANHWPSTTPPNIRLDPATGLTQCDVNTAGCEDYPDDNSFGATDDEMYANTRGIGDVTVDGQSGTYIAVCPICSCISTRQTTIAENTFGDISSDSDSDECSIVGTGFDCQLVDEIGDEDDEQHQCNTPFPLYSDDAPEDDLNRDDMHPSDPYDYYAFPFNVCPRGPKDRIGLVAVDQETYTEEKIGSRFRMHSTAEAFGHLLPYCSVYKFVPNPEALYSVQVTVTDNTPGSTTAPETVYLTSEFAAPIQTSPSGTNSLGNIFAEILALSPTDGNFGTEIDGMIVVCNGTDDLAGGGNALNTLNMAVNYDPDDPDITPDQFFEQFQNPWRYIAQETAIFWEGSARQILIGRGIPNADLGVTNNLNLGDLGGLLPLKEMLQNLPHVRPGTWWFYVDPVRAQTIHSGCKGLAMPVEFLGNDANAATVCAGNRHKCQPSGLEGHDWLLQQRFYDSDLSEFTIDQCNDMGIGQNDIRLNTQTQRLCGKISGNGGRYERYLRDVLLTEYTPGVTSGRMLDIISEPDCFSYKTLLDSYRHMPPGFVQDSFDNGATCAAQGIYPTGFIQGGHYLFDDPSIQGNSDILAFLRVAIADALLLSASSQVSSGEILDPPDPTCVVGADSTQGAIKAYIKNTGTTTGSYRLSATCDSGVTVTNQANAVLEAGQQIQLTLGLRHAGNGSATTADCTLELGLPSVPGYSIDTLQIDDCVVSAASNPNIIASNGSVDSCVIYGTNCGGNAGAGSGGALSDPQGDADTIGLLVVVIVLVVLLVVFFVLFFSCRNLSFKALTRKLMNKKALESYKSDVARLEQQREDTKLATSIQLEQETRRSKE